MWFVLSLVTACFWATAQTLIKKGTAYLTPLWNNTLAALIYLILFVPYGLLTGAEISLNSLYFFLITSICLLYLFYYYGLEKGQLSISATIMAAYPAITITLARIFLGESMSFVQIFLILLIILGGLLISLPQQSKNRKENFNPWNLFWPILAAFSLGTGDFLAKFVLNDVSIATYLFFFPFAFFFAILVFWTFDVKGRVWSKKIKAKHLIITIVGITLMNLGVITFNTALSLGKASLVAPISSSYAGLTIVLAFYFLKEKVNKLQFLGICLMLSGIIFLGA